MSGMNPKALATDLAIIYPMARPQPSETSEYWTSRQHWLNDTVVDALMRYMQSLGAVDPDEEDVFPLADIVASVVGPAACMVYALLKEGDVSDADIDEAWRVAVHELDPSHGGPRFLKQLLGDDDDDPED